MKPINFKEGNSTLKGWDDIDTLPVCKTADMIISKWKAGFIERLKILFTGKVWFSIMRNKTHAPIRLSIKYPFYTRRDIRKIKRNKRS